MIAAKIDAQNCHIELYSNRFRSDDGTLAICIGFVYFFGALLFFTMFSTLNPATREAER